MRLRRYLYHPSHPGHPGLDAGDGVTLLRDLDAPLSYVVRGGRRSLKVSPIGVSRSRDLDEIILSKSKSQEVSLIGLTKPS